MKTLIVGGRGMLGQAFERLLRSRGWNFESWDREELDITSARQVDERIRAFGPELIINTAAYNAVDRAEDESEVAMAVNGTAVGYLANAAARSGACFVHFSSDYVFDGLLPDGYTEEAIPNPISVYGASKLMGEQALIGVAAQLPMRWYLVRTSRLFGESGTSPDAKKSFPELMITLARERGTVSVIDAEISSPTFVDDLARETLALVTADRPAGIYHRTNSGSATWYAYAKVALEAAGVRGEVVPVGLDHFPRKAARPQYSILCSTKLPPLRPWHEALDEFLRNTVEFGARREDRVHQNHRL